jgi:polysaccharide pyruvyl transferase WcaK-like protein
MRLCIAGFYGWGNSGDEAILQAIMDELGWENEYIVCTSLPYTLHTEYKRYVPNIEQIRTLDDVRLDYDVYLLGGGELPFGYGWQQVLHAFANNKPCINYAVGYRTDKFYHPRLDNLIQKFQSFFNRITVRDEYSQNLLKAIGVNSILTMCPAINLKETKVDCPEGMIAVCPRFEDFDVGDNSEQINWIVNRLKEVADEVLLIPFSPRDREGHLRDLHVCKEIAKQLKGSRILETDGYHPRQIKYAISKSKLVISGGRYHAVLWAIAHNVPYEMTPIKYSKLQRLVYMHKKYGRDKLLEMERENLKVFKEVVEHG